MTLYLSTIKCTQCDRETTFAHEGANTLLDHETPWPDVRACPLCAAPYPDDLGAYTTEVTEAVRAPSGTVENETDQCLYCLGAGTVKRRYGTASGGPARVTKTRECPNCGGTGDSRGNEP